MNPERLLMIDLSGPQLTPEERAFLAEHPVGGVCLFARNIRDRFQVAELTAELRALCGESLLVATDQEGGGVVRSLDVPYPPGAMALGAADDPALTEKVGAATARGLRAQGINLNFAPVADVNNNPRNPVIADRSFGEDPERVARHVAAFIRGTQGAGVAACVKHFPGHGDTETDSHLGLPVLEADSARLEGLEFVPFRAAMAADVAAVMSAHIVLPQFDPAQPATLSRAVLTGLLREHLGFGAVIFTDALNMRAVADRTTPTEAVLGALSCRGRHAGSRRAAVRTPRDRVGAATGAGRGAARAERGSNVPRARFQTRATISGPNPIPRRPGLRATQLFCNSRRGGHW